MSDASQGDAQRDRPLRQTVERFERPLTLYAHRIVGDWGRARDVVQETFARLVVERDRTRREQGGLHDPPAGADPTVNGHLAQWLYTVCRHRALDVRRKERRMTRLSDLATTDTDAPDADAFESPTPSPAADAERRDSSRRVLTLLDRLPPNQQEVLRLKFQGGLSYREIASVTKLTESNVGFLIHTGLKRLREQMTRDDDRRRTRQP